MKKLLLALFLCSLCVVGWSQKKTIVSGSIGIKDVKNIVLCTIENGAWRAVDTTSISGNGSFIFHIEYPKSGIWALTNEFRHPRSRPVYRRFYLKEGEQINLTIRNNWNLYSYEKPISKENKILYDWDMTYDEMFNILKPKTFKELYPMIEGFMAKADAICETIKKLKDKDSQRLLTLTIGYDKYYGLCLYKMSPNAIHPTAEEVHPIYAELFKRETFANDDLLDYHNGLEYIKIVTTQKSQAAMKAIYVEKTLNKTAWDVKLSHIESKKLKGASFGSEILAYRTYEDFQTDYDKYEELIWIDRHRKQVADFKAQYEPYSAGKPAFDFTYPDATGKMVSLSDFKGKVVVVDVWATWCGPCKEQIPHLVQLEQEFHGKDVVFMGVSIDVPAKKQEWLNIIQKENMKGVQLFVGEMKTSKICNDYKITGIPRFMIFNKNGTICTTNAPKPSDPKFKELLLETLKK